MKAMDDLDAAIRQVQAGDRDAYRVVVQRCEATVRLVVAAALPPGAPIDDVVNEVFLTAYLKLREYERGTDFAAWVRSIAWHKAQNERRRWRRNRAREEAFGGEILERVAADVDAGMRALRADLYRPLRECVQALAPAARAIVEKHYFHEVACSDIGRAEGRPEGWARLVLFRAREAIARCLRSKGVMAEGS